MFNKLGSDSGLAVGGAADGGGDFDRNPLFSSRHIALFGLVS